MTDSHFTNLYRENHPALIAFAKRFANNQSDVEDLVQETAMKAYKGKHTFKVGSNFKSWAFTILRNSFITKYNKRKKGGVVSMPVEDLIYAVDKGNLTRNCGERILKREAIMDSLQLVSQKCREPFLLFIQGFKYEEIAKQLNIPLGTVKSRISFTRKKLQDSAILTELRRA